VDGREAAYSFASTSLIGIVVEFSCLIGLTYHQRRHPQKASRTFVDRIDPVNFLRSLHPLHSDVDDAGLIRDSLVVDNENSD
jgi:hypothetical protein